MQLNKDAVENEKLMKTGNFKFKITEATRYKKKV